MNYNHYICSAFIMSLLMIPQRTIAQSNGQNHIVSQTMLDSLGSSTIKTVQYYDGLGRPDVLATGGLSTNGKYVYTKTDYNMLGNPVRIQFCDHNITEYVYSADGRRLKTIHRTSVPRSDMLSIGATASLSASETLSVDSTDYIGNYICDNGTPKRYLFDGGYMVLYTNTCTPRYFFKDHLGNNRVVTTLAGTAQQINNYYPYGGTTPISTEQGYQPYKYNDKEYDPMHGLNQYDYLARQYDPAIARFNSMDPLAEKYYHISPYTYCAGNPVKYVDPDGRYIAWFDEKGNEWKYNLASRAFVNSLGEHYVGSNKAAKKLTKMIQTLQEKPNGEELIRSLAERTDGVRIVFSNKSCQERARTAYSLDDNSAIKSVVYFCHNQYVDGFQTDYTNLAHELAHAQDRLNNTMDDGVWFKITEHYCPVKVGKSIFEIIET